MFSGFFFLMHRSVGRSYCRVKRAFLYNFKGILEYIDRILAEFHENSLRVSVLTRRRQGESSGCILVTPSYERALKCRVARNFFEFYEGLECGLI